MGKPINEDPLVVLDEIAAMVKPLKPPVVAFEKSIRSSSFRILISVLLSARTRDPVTRDASERLFTAAPSAREMARLDEEEIAALIFPVGFYKQKARHIKAIAEKLKETGDIPSSFDELTALPGVGRKTANLVIALAFDRPSIAVDTHVFRISKRLGWAAGSTPEAVEAELRERFPPQHWNRINQTLVGFGQSLCKPQNPLCAACAVSDRCPFFLDSATAGSGTEPGI